MSQWWLTNPQPNQLGLTQLPLAAPDLADDQRAAGELHLEDRPGDGARRTRAIDTDDAQYLARHRHGDGDLQRRRRGTCPSPPAARPVAVSPAALRRRWRRWARRRRRTSRRKAKHVAERAKPAAAQDPTLTRQPDDGRRRLGRRRQPARTRVNNAWGNATTPGSVAGGAAAVRALEVFFGGLPGGVALARTVTADAGDPGTAPTITRRDRQRLRARAGRQRLAGRQAGRRDGRVGVDRGRERRGLLHAPGVLAAGTYDYTLSYAGDDQIAAFTETGSLTVTPADPWSDDPDADRRRPSSSRRRDRHADADHGHARSRRARSRAPSPRRRPARRPASTR